MNILLLAAALLQTNPVEKYDWLIGTWAGAGGHEGMGAYEGELVYEWAMDRRFIRNAYVMKSGGKVVWGDSGMIGWDAEKKCLYGFSFGADGTIGWAATREDEDGVVHFEGRTAGPQVKEDFRARLRRIDDDHIEFVSIVEMDGKLVEQAPAKFERKKFEPATPPEDEALRLNAEHLKPLDYLVGRWKGSGETAQGAFEAEYTFAWALNGNFLFKTIEAKAMGATAYAATEWIGYDVEQEKVVVIGFTSEGTIVRGTASAVGDPFVVEGDAGKTIIRRDGEKLSVDVNDGEKKIVVERVEP